MRELSWYRGIPKQVRIGCYIFSVEVQESEDSEAQSTFGHVNLLSQKIRIRPGMTAQNLANTFIHEVIHGIHWFHGVRMDGEAAEVEEDFTVRTANGLCAFWQDNPAAAKWWAKTNNLGFQGNEGAASDDVQH